MTPAAARQRRRRERIANGRIVLRNIEAPEEIVDALIAAKFLDPADADRSEAIVAAFERVAALWVESVTRDYPQIQ